jgi:hypothetical protein
MKTIDDNVQKLFKCNASVHEIVNEDNIVHLMDSRSHIMTLHPTENKPIYILQSYQIIICISQPKKYSNVIFFLPLYKYSITTQQHERKFFKKYSNKDWCMSDFKMLDNLQEILSIDKNTVIGFKCTCYSICMNSITYITYTTKKGKRY